MSGQLELLPFSDLLKMPAPIVPVGRRAAHAEVAGVGQQNIWVEFEQLRQREDFNGRRIYEDIEETAAMIAATGMLPLNVDMVEANTLIPPPITDYKLIALIEVGNRRYRACKLLWDRGILQELKKPGIRYGQIECYRNNPEDMTDLDRLIRIFSTNNHRRLKTMEAAMLVRRLVENFDVAKTSDQISKLVGVSRQQVDIMLTLAYETEEIQDAIWNNEVKTTAVVKMNQYFKEPEKRLELLKLARKNGETISIHWVEEKFKATKTTTPEVTAFQPREGSGLAKLLENVDVPIGGSRSVNDALEEKKQRLKDAMTGSNNPTDPAFRGVSPAEDGEDDGLPGDFDMDEFINRQVQAENDSSQEEEDEEPQALGNWERDQMKKSKQSATIQAPYDPKAEEASRRTSAAPPTAKSPIIDKGIYEGKDETYMCTEISGFFDKIEIEIGRLGNEHKLLKNTIEQLCGLGRQRTEIVKIFTEKAEIR